MMSMNDKDCGASPKRHYRLKAEPGRFGASMTPLKKREEPGS